MGLHLHATTRLQFLPAIALVLLLVISQMSISEGVAAAAENGKTEFMSCDDVINAARRGDTEALRRGLMSKAETHLSQFVNSAGKKESVNCVDTRGYSAIHHAARKGHLTAVKLLLDLGASASSKEKNQKHGRLCMKLRFTATL